MQKIYTILSKVQGLPVLLILSALLPLHTYAQDGGIYKNEMVPPDTPTHGRLSLHLQTTYIYQYKPLFSADYSGANSLQPNQENVNSLSSTLYIGGRLWKGAELYIDPEVNGGDGLSGAFGMAASTNAETYRVGNPTPTLYLARGYIRQTITLFKAKDTLMADAQNQVQTTYSTRSLSFFLGKFSLGDIFDNNTYATGPRTSFLNWCLMNNGAWDYAADLRGYTYCFTTMLSWDNMSYKIALATLPYVANGTALNTNLSEEYSLNAEVTRTFKLHHKNGNLRLLGYYNNGDMGNYQQAISDAAPGSVPNLISTRRFGRDKYGFGLNFDQQLSETLGFFARAGWNDGHNETWCFTEADQSISAGLSINGAGWKRKDDNVGVAIVVNGLSKTHEQYLADGGLGFQLGDGALSYANETLAECYYSYNPQICKGLWLTGDYQFALNPGYNSARGPVSVFSIRLHVEL